MAERNAVSSKRSSRINIRVSPEVHERLKRVAERLAMPPTTVAAYALSDWLADKEYQLRLVERATDQLVSDLSKSDELTKSQLDFLSKLLGEKV